ncbi:hypothetical protein AB0E08_07535 [Streptomyces sp. NPDC048281]|uniref:hypothetical protein n=1 Tax=Streptomyces sp. NPDC048281 TaxID=3154715 RepID=UPI00342AE9EC
MSHRYTCRRHGVEERTHGDIALQACGHDGTMHYCCQPSPAPHGTPRPEGWPVCIVWRTEAPPTPAMLDAMRDADARPHGEFPRNGVAAAVLQGLIDRGLAARRTVGEVYGGPLRNDRSTAVFLTDAGRDCIH